MGKGYTREHKHGVFISDESGFDRSMDIGRMVGILQHFDVSDAKLQEEERHLYVL